MTTAQISRLINRDEKRARIILGIARKLGIVKTVRFDAMSVWCSLGYFDALKKEADTASTKRSRERRKRAIEKALSDEYGDSWENQWVKRKLCLGWHDAAATRSMPPPKTIAPRWVFDVASASTTEAS